MRSITGKYLSFPKLQEYIENQEKKERVLFELALLFKGLAVDECESWNNLAIRFFETYGEQIFRSCGYETGTSIIRRIRVIRTDLFMSYMGAMVRTGIIGDCSFTQLADYLDLEFDTGGTKNTVLNKLKEQNPEFICAVEQMNAEIKKSKLRKLKM